MAILDRDVYIRNYVMGVLCNYQQRGISIGNISDLATDITNAVIEGDTKWQEEQCCEQVRCMNAELEEDIPQ